jgi:hypothetical protein
MKLSISHMICVKEEGLASGRNGDIEDKWKKEVSK